MFGGLTILAALAAIGAIAVLFEARKNLAEVSKYCTVGLVIALIDFVTEYAGTQFAGWQYNQSVYMIARLVPIELVILFFSAGIILRATYLYLTTKKSPAHLDVLLYLTMGFAIVMYVWDLWAHRNTVMLTFAAPFGLWGILNVSEHRRNWAVIIALIVGAIDFVIETFLVQYTGNYGYTLGFSLLIPFSYAFITLGLIGIIERLNSEKKSK